MEDKENAKKKEKTRPNKGEGEKKLGKEEKWKIFIIRIDVVAEDEEEKQGGCTFSPYWTQEHVYEGGGRWYFMK